MEQDEEKSPEKQKKDEFCSEETIKRGQEASKIAAQTSHLTPEEERKDAEKWRNEG